MKLIFVIFCCVFFLSGCTKQKDTSNDENKKVVTKEKFVIRMIEGNEPSFNVSSDINVKNNNNLESNSTFDIERLLINDADNVIEMMKSERDFIGTHQFWYKLINYMSIVSEEQNYKLLDQIIKEFRDIILLNEYKQGPLVLEIKNVNTLIMIVNNGIDINQMHMGWGLYTEKSVLDFFSSENERNELISAGISEYINFDYDFDNKGRVKKTIQLYTDQTLTSASIQLLANSNFLFSRRLAIPENKSIEGYLGIFELQDEKGTILGWALLTQDNTEISGYGDA